MFFIFSSSRRSTSVCSWRRKRKQVQVSIDTYIQVLKRCAVYFYFKVSVSCHLAGLACLGEIEVHVKNSQHPHSSFCCIACVQQWSLSLPGGSEVSPTAPRYGHGRTHTPPRSPLSDSPTETQTRQLYTKLSSSIGNKNLTQKSTLKQQGRLSCLVFCSCASCVLIRPTYKKVWKSVWEMQQKM